MSSLFFLFGNTEVSQWCLFIQHSPFLQWTEFCNYHNAPAGFADRAGVSVRAVAGIAAACLGQRRKKMYFLVEILHSCSLKGEFFSE